MCDGVHVGSLYIMSKWVESSELATPTQQHMAEKVSTVYDVMLSGYVSYHDDCYCPPIQMISRLQNGMETETCPICQTCITHCIHVCM